jgi:hypothetical protein
VCELWPLVGSPAGVCGPCVGISGRLEIGVALWRSGLVLTVHFGWLGNGRRRPVKTPKKAADSNFGLDGDFGLAENGLASNAGQ